MPQHAPTIVALIIYTWEQYQVSLNQTTQIIGVDSVLEILEDQVPTYKTQTSCLTAEQSKEQS